MFAITDIYDYTNDDDTCKKTQVNIYNDCPMFSEQMLTSLIKSWIRWIIEILCMWNRFKPQI